MDTADLSESLLELATNHRWTWSPSTRSIFESLPGHQPGRHPVEVVSSLGEAELVELLGDRPLTDSISQERSALAELNASRRALEVAYFSPEFGISELIPQYSGGLGILAGDHLKAASDADLPMCGVGLFYREGYFRQSVVDGRQTEIFEPGDPSAIGCVDTGVEVVVPLAGDEVVARVWCLEVGRSFLLLLDTDVESNDDHQRAITDRLYGGDRRHRIEQEMVLGVGGARALAALGWDVPVKHLNEGHAGFMILEQLDGPMSEAHSLDEALALVRPGVVFTTHTPVAAGIDRFDDALVSRYLDPWADRWDVPLDHLLALGADPSDDPGTFNMAAFCLRAAGRANGVSILHGQVSRDLFASVPGGERIDSVTNGVHARTWVRPELADELDRALGPAWSDGDPACWDRVDEFDDDRIRSIRRAATVELGDLVLERARVGLDPDALTVGFARRFAPYKRATLLLQLRHQLVALLAADDRPIQFVFAGKAHPANDPGKALLAEILAFSASPEAHGRFVFVPDYDMAVGRAMCAGCDIWLNHPVRPQEASGTSGQKSALNGGLNLSISDGWWDEMADERNGWTIPSSAAEDPAERDAGEAASVLTLLTSEIVPEYYADGGPRSTPWIDRIRYAWRSLGPRVTAARMVAEYERQLYAPARAEVRDQ